MEEKLLELTAQIVVANMSSVHAHASEIPDLIASTYNALARCGAPAPTVESATDKPTPAVTARKSLASTSHIISLIDGKPYKTLRRHLSRHGYTAESYREAFGLPASYPMVAPDYSESRRNIAVKLGLGRKPAVAARARKR